MRILIIKKVVFKKSYSFPFVFGPLILFEKKPLVPHYP